MLPRYNREFVKRIESNIISRIRTIKTSNIKILLRADTTDNHRSVNIWTLHHQHDIDNVVSHGGVGLVDDQYYNLVHGQANA